MIENISDPQTLYKELLFSCFEKIKKHLQKKYKDIAQIITQSSGCLVLSTVHLNLYRSVKG